VPWALIEGDTETGVTAHYIDPGVDTGRILARRRTPIGPDDTQATLSARCLDLAVELWPEALERVVAGDPGEPQADGGCSHRRGPPHGGQIDEDWPEELVERFIRAMTLPPLPYAGYRGVPVRSLAQYRRLRALAAPAAR
jgi:methionyl-tRNA formyltransferase